MKINPNLMYKSNDIPATKWQRWDAQSIAHGSDGDFTRVTLSNPKRESTFMGYCPFTSTEYEAIPEGTTYTISFLVKNYRDNAVVFNTQDDTSNTVRLERNETKVVSITATRKAGSLQIRANSTAVGYALQFSTPRFLKLEIGTVATTWIPAKADLTAEQVALMPENLFGGGIEWTEIPAI